MRFTTSILSIHNTVGKEITSFIKNKLQPSPGTLRYECDCEPGARTTQQARLQPIKNVGSKFGFRLKSLDNNRGIVISDYTLYTRTFGQEGASMIKRDARPKYFRDVHCRCSTSSPNKNFQFDIDDDGKLMSDSLGITHLHTNVETGMIEHSHVGGDVGHSHVICDADLGLVQCWNDSVQKYGCTLLPTNKTLPAYGYCCTQHDSSGRCIDISGLCRNFSAGGCVVADISDCGCNVDNINDLVAVLSDTNSCRTVYVDGSFSVPHVVIIPANKMLVITPNGTIEIAPAGALSIVGPRTTSGLIILGTLISSGSSGLQVGDLSGEHTRGIQVDGIYQDKGPTSAYPPINFGGNISSGAVGLYISEGGSVNNDGSGGNITFMGAIEGGQGINIATSSSATFGDISFATISNGEGILLNDASFENQNKITFDSITNGGTGIYVDGSSSMTNNNKLIFTSISGGSTGIYNVGLVTNILDKGCGGTLYLREIKHSSAGITNLGTFNNICGKGENCSKSGPTSGCPAISLSTIDSTSIAIRNSGTFSLQGVYVGARDISGGGGVFKNIVDASLNIDQYGAIGFDNLTSPGQIVDNSGYVSRPKNICYSGPYSTPVPSNACTGIEGPGCTFRCDNIPQT